MGEIGSFLHEKLIIGCLFSDERKLVSLKDRLREEFGPADFESRIFPFKYTDYYNREMGERIFRIFYSFKNHVNPEDLAAMKIKTNNIENEYTDGKCRSINLDPGLLNLSRLILASTKNNAQRVPLKDGIYAEVTLLYRQGRFVSLPWTYPDFKSGDYDEDLIKIRKKYNEFLKQQG